MTVKIRLYLGFGFLVLTLVCLGIFSILQLNSLNNKSAEIAHNWLPGVILISGVNTLTSDYRIEEYRHIITTSEQAKDASEKEMASINDKIKKSLADYEKTISDETDRKMFGAIKSQWERYLQINQKVFILSRQLKTDEAMNLMRNESQDGFNSVSGQLEQLVEYNSENGLKVSKEGDDIYDRSKLTLIIVIAVVALIGIVTALFVSRSISNPLKEIEEIARQVAQGDLRADSIKVNNHDEIGSLGNSFNMMKDNLTKLIRQLTSSANSLNRTASELAAQSQQTSASASENAATMTEIAATVEQVTSNVQKISMASGVTTDHANKGNKGVIDVTRQMQQITNSSNGVAAVIESLSKTSREISQIVELITNIADQTNLLALNAAIEAARAGDQGRGFAVVAEEVRKLAEQSANAAKDIKNLIGAIQLESEKAVDKMAVSNREVESGATVVEEVGESFKEIIKSIQGLTTQIQETASATEEMSAGVQNVAASTEEQTAAMEEVSASAETLSKLANDLNIAVSQFKI